MSLTPTQKKHVRTAMTAYCLKAEANERAWHYSQARPFHYVNDPGIGWVSADCSGYVSMVFHDAMHDTGIFLTDPLGFRYAGWGWTGSEEAWLRANGKRVHEVNGFFVGDIARWGEGSHAHTAVCRKTGSASVAVWSSHGQEAGPMGVKINYRNDLVGTWRHPALL